MYTDIDLLKNNMTPSEAWNRGADWMLEKVRESLESRLGGRPDFGDIEVMSLVDEIVRKESGKQWKNQS